MADPFIAEIRMFGFNFAPVGWARCNGALLPIAQNTALFSLIGTFYGGNGISTFGLPDLQGASPLGAGTGPGLTPREQGEKGGVAAVALLPSEMPAHSHGLQATASATTAVPAGAALATAGNGAAVYRAPGVLAPMAAEAVAAAGASQPHRNRQPYQAVTFCIALQGIFPPRD